MRESTLRELTLRLKNAAPTLQLEENADMARYTTLHLGGPADLMANPDDAAQIPLMIDAARALDVPVTVIGNGSNLLVRSGEFFDAKSVSDLIAESRQLGYQIETLYLEASDDVLVSRYKETRRDHPLAGENVSLIQAIGKERAIMQPLRETANYIIDPSVLKPRQLRQKLEMILSGDSQPDAMHIEMNSFGYKRGLPMQADLVFDVRFLPNPFYIPGLGRHTGLDADVRDFVLGHPVTQEFMTKMQSLLTFLIPHYQEEGKHRLSIAIGCTGGAHRSVAICEALAAFLREQGYAISVTHRDLELEQAHWKERPEVQ